MGRLIPKVLRQIWSDTQGVSIVEFALMLPLLILVGAGGLELINFVLANQKIERIASITADNVSRNTLQPSERSINDTFSATDDIAAPFNLNDKGRVIITSVIGVPQDGEIVAKVVWQRCSGLLAGIASAVGEQANDPTKWAQGSAVTLPNNAKLQQNQMAIISEVAYDYDPIISLTQLPDTSDKVVRQLSIFVSRTQAATSVTPSPGVTPSNCT